jgi:hypothetical protein
MAESTGPILAIGAITMGRDVLLDRSDVDWRIPLATGIAAAMFAGAERAVGSVAPAVAYLALITVVFARTDPKKPSPAEALLSAWNRGR